MPDATRPLDVLGAYLAELRAGRRPDRARWLAHHPELAVHLDHLDALTQPPTADATAPHPSHGPGRPPDAPTVGELIVGGKYEVLGVVGRGGMGVVYKARQVGLDRLVAVKMILNGALATDEQVRRFHDEARAAARAQHP